MKLLILPGAGNPLSPDYKEANDLIESFALNQGFDTVDRSIIWPGQSLAGDDPGTRLTLGSAFYVACEKCMEMERQDIQYQILGRSFGAIVAASLGAKFKFNNLNKLILWGPPPYWMAWKWLKKELAIYTQKWMEKGCYIDENYFLTLEPVEALLGEINYPTVIATGTEDIYCQPAFLEYLRATYGDSQQNSFNPKLIFTKPVEGAPHVVTNNLAKYIVADYEKALFL